MNKLDFIKSIDALKGFSEKSLNNLLAIMEFNSAAPGQAIFQEGDPSEHIYIVAAGEAAVVKKLSEDKEKVLSILTPNNFFGEMSLFFKKNRTASVLAKNDFSYFKIKTEDFKKILSSEPVQLQQLLESLLFSTMARLEQTSRELATVYEISKIAAKNLTLQEFCAETIKELCFSVTGIDAGIFFTWNEFTEEFDPCAFCGNNLEVSSIPADSAIISFLKDKTEAVLLDNPGLMPIGLQFEKKPDTVLLIPLAKLRLAGFLMLVNTKDNVHLTQGTFDLLNSISKQLIEIVENIKIQQEKMDKDRFDRGKGQVTW